MERKYEILTGSLEREFWRLVESRERKREEERERKEKMGAASSKVAASASSLSRQVYDEPTQTRHLAANWPPSYRSLAPSSCCCCCFCLIPNPVESNHVHRRRLVPRRRTSVHRRASERDPRDNPELAATFSPCNDTSNSPTFRFLFEK